MRGAGRRRYTLSGFYVRRARRILPAVTVVVAACLVAGYYLMAPGQYAQTAQAARGVATISANMYFARIKADYWDQSLLADQPLLHTWSLAVEEQFYVGLPLLLWLLYRLGIAGHRGDIARARRMALGALRRRRRLVRVRTTAAGGASRRRVLPSSSARLGTAHGVAARHLAAPGAIASGWLRNAAGGLGIALIAASIVS